MTDEIKIIQKCQKGDLEKFGILYDKYIKKIYNFIYFKTHHKETAEDLTSQTFFKALDKINSFKIEEGFFSAWLFQIARNTVIDHYRTQKYNLDIDEIWDLSDDIDIERDIDTKEKLKEVEKYLKKLTSEQREIVIMRIWQGMSYREIVEVTGKTEASLKMMYSRTINKLRQDMPLALFISMLLLF